MIDLERLRRVWERTHKTKIHYISKQEAQHQLRRFKKKYSGGRLEVYPCKICGQYVIGTRQKKTKIPIQKVS